MTRTRKTLYCAPVSKGKQEWVKGARDLWKCTGCGRTGLLIRGRHRSWPPPVHIPVWGDWRGARNEIIGQALVSPIDAYLQDWKWRANKRGYVYRQTSERIDGEMVRRNLFLHRVILKLGPGDPLEGHHKDDNPWNNQRWNLEVVTREENELYKYHRNIRNGTLPTPKAPEVPPVRPTHREAIREIVRGMVRQNPHGFTTLDEVLVEAAGHGMTKDETCGALDLLMLQNVLYAKAGPRTYAVL